MWNSFVVRNIWTDDIETFETNQDAIMFIELNGSEDWVLDGDLDE